MFWTKSVLVSIDLCRFALELGNLLLNNCSSWFDSCFIVCLYLNILLSLFLTFISLLVIKPFYGFPSFAAGLLWFDGSITATCMMRLEPPPPLACCFYSLFYLGNVCPVILFVGFVCDVVRFNLFIWQISLLFEDIWPD